jgi:hypothetical protein
MHKDVETIGTRKLITMHKDVETIVTRKLITMHKDSYRQGICKVFSPYDKCQIVTECGKFVGQHCNKCDAVLLELEINNPKHIHCKQFHLPNTCKCNYVTLLYYSIKYFRNIFKDLFPTS